MKKEKEPNTSDQVYTVEEVAKRFKVSERTVYQWVYKGHLITFKIGNNLRITESSLQLFIEESKNILQSERK